MVNKVILIGNVGKDPEVKYLDNNLTIAKFPLATSESYTNKNGERISNTEWHNIVCWRNLAQIAEKYVKKGTLLFVEGKITTRSYDDKDGNKRYITEIVADNFRMIGNRNTSSESVAAEPLTAPAPKETFDNTTESENTDVDDLPF